MSVAERTTPGQEPVPAARPVSTASIRAAIVPILDRLRDTSAQRDAERTHPFAEIRSLAEAGILRYRVPREDGGAGATVRELTELVVDIAAADSNVAQALRPGFLVADGLATGTLTGAKRERTLARVLAGDLFAGTRNEAAGKPGQISTRLTRDSSGLRVTGEKFYSTGGLHARWFSGNAVDDDGGVVTFTVPTDGAGVDLIDDFDAVGQRLTASGTTRLDGVLVDPDEVDASTAQTQHPHGSLAHLILAAALAGIAEAAQHDAVRLVRAVTRPIKHSTAARSAEDPYVRLAVGRIATAAFTARAQVASAAEQLDAYWAEPGEPLGVRATIAVAEAYVGAGEQALAAGELLFDVGGGTLTRRKYNLDRHWRNARTVANHNPRGWKSAAVGGWLVADEPPPANGLF
ncbi:acyl-CoA dehydrogenase family protein [Arthrobacter sp. H-02-3]|uniref:acyl-CoA dehydrogenase family protein n=1 Tax=Arthrobacter sp. H-02-3 TaxID=2703675 RepID=UPI000DD1C85A|nr:acyl-CoA dehydrogenase family protein [Arthrobacter sp. H-02-3]PVZ53861.1 acyl-CoA dehydrogenase [Arthrobacter sp. H-02-3]